MDERERWHVGGRYYMVTLASPPDTMDLELEDVGPGVSRGIVVLASRNDQSGQIIVRVWTNDPLPIELLEKFMAEAQRCLPPLE